MLLSLACKTTFADPSREFGAPIEGESLSPEIVHAPPREGVWHAPLGGDDPSLPRSAACGTCHESADAPPPQPRFHRQIEIEHGELGCDSCHDSDRRVLHLADGRTIDFSEVLTLCSQCHGPQYAAFQHGAHGGKSGHWDRRQGPVERNTCTDCHLPHAPAFRRVMPVFPPHDRHLGGH